MSEEPQDSSQEESRPVVDEPAPIAAAPGEAPTFVGSPEPAAPPEPEPAPPPPFAEPISPPPDASASAAQRPEVAVGAAFAGGFALALILKRLGR